MEKCSLPRNPSKAQYRISPAFRLYERLREVLQNGDSAKLRQELPSLQTLNCDFGVWPPERPLLHHACGAANASLEDIEYLLDLGSDINFQDTTSGYTPLHQAAYYGRTEVVKLLLKRGASTTLLNCNRETPADAAKANNHTEVANLLQRDNSRGSPQVASQRDEAN
ncbi:E3 ubiquitin-protein ligase HTD1 [Balamuthia mandrillaris]